MQAGAYDTVLILFYFSLSLSLSTFAAQPLFSNDRPTCNRRQSTGIFSFTDKPVR